jgi:hypothetical protein
MELFVIIVGMSIIIFLILYSTFIITFNLNSRKSPKEKEVVAVWARNWKKHKNTTDFLRYRIQRFGHSYSLYEVKKKFKNDMTLWRSYSRYLKETRESSDEKRERIEHNLNAIKQDLRSDFHRNPHGSKITTTRGVNGKNTVNYTFDNGNFLSMENGELTITTRTQKITYTLGLYMRRGFIDIFNRMISKLNSNDYNRDEDEYGYSTPPPPKKEHDHPKRGLYNTIKDTVERREQQLNKSDYSKGERESLMNDLENSKRKLKDIKDKYNF